MSKTILVPTDYSKGAEHAVQYAMALAKKEKADILLVHAFHASYNVPDLGRMAAEDISVTEKREIKKLQDFSDSLARSGKITCNYMVRHGLAVDVILEAIKEKRPQMVIMGTKGAGWLKEKILGSNTAKVIENARCPVIAVPEHAEYKGLKKITYATDYHASDVTALKKIVEIAKPFKAEISVIHAADDEYTPDIEEELLGKFRKMASDKIHYDKLKFKVEKGKQLEKALEEHINKESPDVLAMSTHYRGILDKIFGTSITKKMAYHSQIPLLAFHHKHESVIFI